jgi:protein TonB
MRRGAIISVVLHVLILVLLLVGIPFWKTSEEPPPDDTVAMVFEGAAATSMNAPTTAPADTPEPNSAPPVPEPPKPVSPVPQPPPPPLPEPSPEPPPPPPVQQAEIPPPTPAPAPMPVPPPPKPVAQAHPPRPPPQHVAARAAANPAGAPAHAPAGQNAASSAGGANNGAAWTGRLKQWWDQHSFYPKDASQTNEGGNVKVRIVIAADGQVTSIEVVQSSGLSVLDAAAVAVFRNAHLPPPPSGMPAQPADVVVTLHYRPADSGG